MRIRTIKPEFFKHDVVASLNPLTRLLFVGLWCMADCAGRLEDRPARIKVEVLPYDSDADVDAMLDALHDVGLIVRYRADETGCIQVASFRAHQRITGKEAETVSRFPVPTPETTGKHSGNNGETTWKQLGRQEGKGRETEGKGNGREGGAGGQIVCAAGAAPAANDGEWLASLRENPAYSGTDIDREYAKMQTWCATNRKTPSRRRFINWLNRIERPMQPATKPVAEYDANGELKW